MRRKDSRADTTESGLSPSPSDPPYSLALEQELLRERKAILQLKDMLADLEAQRLKFYDLHSAAHRDLIAARKEICEMKQSHSREMFERNQVISELRRALQSQAQDFIKHKDQLVQQLRRDFELRFQEMRQNVFAKQWAGDIKSQSQSSSRLARLEDRLNKMMESVEACTQSLLQGQPSPKPQPVVLKTVKKDKKHRADDASTYIKGTAKKEPFSQVKSKIFRTYSNSKEDKRGCSIARQLETELAALRGEFMELAKLKEKDERAEQQMHGLIRKIEAKTAEFVRVKAEAERSH